MLGSTNLSGSGYFFCVDSWHYFILQFHFVCSFNVTPEGHHQKHPYISTLLYLVLDLNSAVGKWKLTWIYLLNVLI